MFDMTEDELADAAAQAEAMAYAAARLAATRCLVAGPASRLGEDAETLSYVLTERDQTDPRFALLTGVEQQWALLVLRIISRVMRPDAAVADARRRGATWKTIANALEVTAQSAQERFGPARRRGL